MPQPAGWNPIAREIIDRWWLLALRGVASILLGIAAFVWPGITLLVLVILFGAYLLVDGVLAVVAGAMGRSWLLVIEGAAGVIQLLTLVTLEPPVSYGHQALRDEKVKVLRAVRPLSPKKIDRLVVRAQYGAGVIWGPQVPGYREEPGVPFNSAGDRGKEKG